MKDATLEEILSGPPSRVVGVDVEGVGKVYLRPMSINTRDAILARKGESAFYEGMTADVIAGCLCDAQGNRLRLSPEQRKRLGDLPGSVDVLLERAAELSGLSDEPSGN